MPKFSRNTPLAAAALLAFLAPTAQLYARTEMILYEFQGYKHADGSYPAGLILDAEGNLFGQTDAGGSCEYRKGCGTIFEIAANGGESDIYMFPGKHGPEPQSELVEDQAGNLYGTARYGTSCGYVYKVAADHTARILHKFKGGSDGCLPTYGLVADASGNLYGATSGGGGDTCQGGRCGTVYRITPDGTLTILYVFEGGDTDGYNPYGGVVVDADGNIYGTTLGADGGTYGSGTVYKISSGGEETILHGFTQTDRGYPFGTLLLDQSGNLYGTMQGSVNTCGECGAVFTVAADGATSVLYSFSGGADGSDVASGLVRDASGNLYGATVGGGTHSLGTVFEVSPAGHEKVLYSFAGGTDGASPSDGVTADQSGNLYGVTGSGGRGCPRYKGCGVVYEIKR